MPKPNVVSRSVLLAITDTHHGFLQGVLRYAREHRWHVTADMIYTGRIPHGWRGDGIVSFIGYRQDLADFVLSSGLPTVEISSLRDDLPLPRIKGDHAKIGQMAADHFLERGFRHFAWAPFMEDHNNRERHRSFAAALRRRGQSCRELPALDPVAAPRRRGSRQTDWSLRRRELIAELAALPKPLAVFSYNDCVAADIIHACEDGGLPVPEAVAVLGVDNDTAFCESIPVPLSSIRHDLEGMAYRSAELLDLLMSGRRAPRRIPAVAPLGLITRRSTDILAVDHLEVARALRYIGDHYRNPQLGVPDIVGATRLSRRPLEKAFRSELKRSIHEEVTRVRLKETRRLLRETDWPVRRIAALCGVARPNHLYRIFRAAFGATPKDFRQRETVSAGTFPIDDR